MIIKIFLQLDFLPIWQGTVLAVHVREGCSYSEMCETEEQEEREWQNFSAGWGGTEGNLERKTGLQTVACWIYGQDMGAKFTVDLLQIYSSCNEMFTGIGAKHTRGQP